MLIFYGNLLFFPFFSLYYICSLWLFNLRILYFRIILINISRNQAIWNGTWAAIMGHSHFFNYLRCRWNCFLLFLYCRSINLNWSSIYFVDIPQDVSGVLPRLLEIDAHYRYFFKNRLIILLNWFSISIYHSNWISLIQWLLKELLFFIIF